MKGMADNTLDLSETHLVWFTEGQDSPTDPDDPRYGGGINIGVKAYDAGPSLHHAIEALASRQGVVPEDLVPSHAEKPVLAQECPDFFGQIGVDLIDLPVINQLLL